MANFRTILTNIGLAKISNAIALGQTISLTHMAVGDGNGNPTTPVQTQTALVREVYRGQLNRLDVDPNNPAYVITELVIPTTVGGWTVHEVGIFDDEGDMVAVANFPATYKPVALEGSTRDLVVRVYIEAVNASVIELKIDPTVVLASRSWVQDNFLSAPGGTTGQLMRKRSNANRDVEWFTPNIDELNITLDAVEESQTLAAGQAVVTTATVTTAGMALYIEGAREFDFTINSPSQFTLGQSYPDGTRIWMVNNDPKANITGDGILKEQGNPETVSEALDKRVINISHLKALPVAELQNGSQYSVAGFYAGTNVGGGNFTYRADVPWSDHNGGTVIAVGALIAWGGTEAGLAGYLDWTGSGSGCFVKNETKKITYEEFGATASGLMSDAKAIEAALSTELPIFPTGGKTYLLTEAVNVTNKNIYVEDSPSTTYKFSGPASRLSFFYDYTDVQPVSALSNDAFVNMGTGAQQTPVAMITVENGASYVAGDVVKIIADDILWGTNPAANERVGEHAVVYSVVGNSIYLDRRLIENDGAYTINVRVAKASKKTVNFGLCSVDGDSDNQTTRNLSHVRFVGCQSLKINGINSKKTQGTVLNVVSSLKPVLGEFRAFDSKTDATVGAFGHVVLFSACSDFYVSRVVGNNVRHCVDTTAFSATPNTAEIWRYGGVVGGFADTVIGFGTQASPASTHNDADGVRFGSVICLNPALGPWGGYSAVGFRGRGCHADNVFCDGGTGVNAFADEPVLHNSRSHTAGNVTVNSRKGWNLCRAVRASGYDGFPVDVSVQNVRFSTDGFNQSQVAIAEYGSIEIGRVEIEGQSLNNTTYLFSSQTQGKIKIDYLAGKNLGQFSLFDVATDSSSAVVNEASVQTSVVWGFLANLKSNNGEFVANRFSVNKAGSAIDLITNRGSSAKTLADWVITEQDSSTRNRKRLPSLAASTPDTEYSVNIEDRLSPVMYTNITTSATGCSIGPISNGNFYGQELVIVNRNDSTQPITLTSTAQGAVLNTSETIQIGRSFRLFWDGFDWRAA